ncbi:bifunctional glutamate N-acetyltransferase/amino-acid acetyltransferase ArgJ [Thiolapillus sp.]
MPWQAAVAVRTEVFPVAGVRLAAVAAGIRYQGRDDLALMELADGSAAAAVFTRNAFCAAPVILARRHLDQADPRYLLINSGNANAGTGEAGMAASRESCRLLAAAAGVAPNQVLPFSTGVIGEDLPTDPFARAAPDLLSSLGEDNWLPAARAIMTTDTVPKLASRRFQVEGKTVTVTGMSKGSGMIRPDMATMLAFVATDALISSSRLQPVLEAAVGPSFNSITVDGDTSTNDACVLVASGAAGVEVDAEATASGRAFRQAVNEVCMELARAIVLDGEGATKLVEIVVEEAGSEAEARGVAYTVAHSPLVKTALFAADPNWGRILAAVGRAGVSNLDISKVRIWLDDVCIVSQGKRDAGYTEEAGQSVMNQPGFAIRVALGKGQARTRILTCDLSYDYVKINAEYRS